MHDLHFTVKVMDHRRRERAHRNRHAWKRPFESKRESLVRRAMAAAAALR